MRIANIMLGRGRGGIEQAFLDYAEGLSRVGHDVISITHPRAAVNAALAGLGGSHVTLPNLGPWDPFAPRKLATLLKTMRTEVILAHGNRAIGFGKRATDGYLPVVAVAHNYQFQELLEADAIIAVTSHMARAIADDTPILADRVYHIPNMIRVRGGFIRPTWHRPPVIGALGRFVAKKGFDIFLHALWNLKQRGVPFQVVIGGSGEEERALKNLAKTLGLKDHVTFPGWVDDPLAFLSELDIFCLPSLHEPFGIVLLEAMSAKLPVVTTDTEGPCEIIKDGAMGLMVQRGNPVQMADALMHLLADENRARTMGANAYHHVKTQYDMDKIAHRIADVLRQVQIQFTPMAAA